MTSISSSPPPPPEVRGQHSAGFPHFLSISPGGQAWAAHFLLLLSGQPVRVFSGLTLFLHICFRAEGSSLPSFNRVYCRCVCVCVYAWYLTNKPRTCIQNSELSFKTYFHQVKGAGTAVRSHISSNLNFFIFSMEFIIIFALRCHVGWIALFFARCRTW